MEKKQLGIVLIIFSLFIIGLTILYQLQLNSLVDQLMAQSGGTCFTKEGKCLHENYAQSVLFPTGIAISLIMLFLGWFFSFNSKVPTILTMSSKQNKFDILLEALDDDEQKVMKIVKDEEGITQATLKYRTNLSKSKLSVVLKDLEKKNLIAKQVKGNTYKIFLKKK